MLMLTLLFFYSCAGKKYSSEFDFANKLAQKGLWKEAHIRWQKIVDSGNESAALYNNIAIALEKMGKPKEAEKAYKKALALSPNNSKIKSNYDRLKKILEKSEE
jgi:Flp pilus assembly protein TadD